MLKIVGQTVHNLKGELAESPGLLSGKIYDELVMLNVHKEANDQTALAFLYVHKLMHNYLFGNISEALECAKEVESYAGAITAMFHDTIYHFYAALSICSAWPNLNETLQLEFSTKLEQHREKLRVWSDNCPINQQHKHLLVEAEWHRLNGEEAAARNAYKLAIELAQNNEFLPEEALAYELAAKFWNELGEISVGELYASPCLPPLSTLGSASQSEAIGAGTTRTHVEPGCFRKW